MLLNFFHVSFANQVCGQSTGVPSASGDIVRCQARPRFIIQQISSQNQTVFDMLRQSLGKTVIHRSVGKVISLTSCRSKKRLGKSEILVTEIQNKDLIRTIKNHLKTIKSFFMISGNG